MNTLTAASAMRSIPYPTHVSEFEVQAWLYSALRAAGLDVRGEVKTIYEAKTKKARGQACRFDLVLFRDQKAVHVFEVKAAPVNHKTDVGSTRQGTRYTTYGVPVTFVYGMSDAEAVLAQQAAQA